MCFIPVENILFIYSDQNMFERVNSALKVSCLLIISKMKLLVGHLLGRATRPYIYSDKLKPRCEPEAV